MELTQKEVKRLFKYDRKNGLLIRRFNHGKGRVGTSSTAKDRDGYLVVGIHGKLYRAHRVIWLYVHGEWPKNDCDHINRIRDDNRIKNLRDITRSQNKQNQSVQDSNKCRLKGVYLHKTTMKWCASIGLNNKNIYIGLFETMELAYKAYQDKAAELHTCNPVATKS